MGIDEARERVEAEREDYYAKRRRIRDAGFNPDKLEQAYVSYRNSMAVLKSISYHKDVIADYLQDDEPKWEDF